MKFSAEGVFRTLINKKAFLDRVVLSLDAIKKEGPTAEARDVVNRAIGGIGRNYARKEQGRLSCGNSYDLTYGRLQPYLPQMGLTVRSDENPITTGVILDGLNAICQPGWRATVSLVELTFDFGGVPLEYFRRNVFSSAHQFRTVRTTGWPTYYVGVRTSPWQARIYQKAETVVRLEFVLRRPFLRQQGINKISDLKKLSVVDFKRRLWLRELDTVGAEELVNKVARRDKRGYRPIILRKWLRDLPLRESVKEAKKRFGGNPQTLMTASPIDKQLRGMQRKLVV